MQEELEARLGMRGPSWSGGPLRRATHVVICVSMKMRMKTRRAGTTDAPIIQTGKDCLSPKGLINQPRLSGDVTEKPEGTLSFCKPQEHKHSHPGPPGLARMPSIHHKLIQVRKKSWVQLQSSI